MAKYTPPKWVLVANFPKSGGVEVGLVARKSLPRQKPGYGRKPGSYEVITSWNDVEKARTITAEVARLLLPENLDELTKRVIECARRTWQTIGGDVLDAACGGNESGSIPRSHVIEVVLDADYMLTNGQDDAAYFTQGILPEKLQAKIFRLAFPFSTYGY